MAYLAEIFSEELSAKERAKKISNAVNCFGFDKKKQWVRVLELGVTKDVLDFAFAWLLFQAGEARDKRYDGRNALSCQVAQKLCALTDLAALRAHMTKASAYTDDVVRELYALHRTLKQTLTGFCLYVLEEVSGGCGADLSSAIDALCASPFHFFAETGFDERTLLLDRSSWYRMPFI